MDRSRHEWVGPIGSESQRSATGIDHAVVSTAPAVGILVEIPFADDAGFLAWQTADAELEIGAPLPRPQRGKLDHPVFQPEPAQSGCKRPTVENRKRHPAVRHIS